MCTRNQLNKISKQMVDIYRDIYGEDVTGVFLYGSYARGDNSEDSDIDIVAIVKGNRLLLQDKLRTVWDLSADIGLENDAIVSPTVIPYDEFEEYKEVLPYYRNIAKEGLRIG
ncbi:MAG: nucleotidyltransferase domain-containing protein [Lachnospiraceae bacterium]|nr:nucleotidyltransferase domain-containing protein [Lachnospiraceae bacterium]